MAKRGYGSRAVCLEHQRPAWSIGPNFHEYNNNTKVIEHYCCARHT